VERLIVAYDLFRHRLKTRHKLVLAGSSELSADVGAAAARSQFRDDIVVTGYLSRPDLAHVFRHADVLIFPSLYEGFGLPPLESMASGVPVAMSRAASLPEVGGDAAIYFDPYDVEGMCDALGQLISDGLLRSQCIQRGLKRARGFTWRRCAVSTLELYEQFIHV
jgi:glycosyltransferase involved in cell wall biosynthesis